MSERRDAYLEKLKAKLDEWNTDLNVLEAKLNRAEASVKAELKKQIADLKVKRAELEAKLEPLRRSTGDAWGDLKAGADLAWEAMSEAIRSAHTRLRGSDQKKD